MKISRTTLSVAASALIGLGTVCGVGAGAAAAQETTTEPTGGLAEKLQTFTNPSELHIEFREDGTWNNTFTNKTGEQVACRVYIEEESLAKRILDWVIDNPEAAAQNGGQSFGPELDAEIRKAYDDYRGVSVVHLADDPEDETPKNIYISPDNLPTVTDIEYRGIAFCKVGGLFGEGPSFIELSPGVSPLVGSVAGSSGSSGSSGGNGSAGEVLHVGLSALWRLFVIAQGR
ncbi:hypothetical protein G7Y29_02585 [Corynebacterium qintianiae]|uniref:Secreted protein n=1 Tax=Corynebacterium qintianiae TaxID=2709392 RepID=A0A7T0KMY5_9CORY|nr:hypothetical protein [Corynebacterium qintianiae]QPK83708.1 hypothetical protein G7Y29_02585 [Corynebacterium qintianiae]